MTQGNQKQPLQWWGGVEPTINRVGDIFFRQLDRSGHRARLSDLDAFAELGLRTLRFPILWEEIAPEAPDRLDWSPVDASLQRLRELGIRPIAGLVHHGSGPHYTSLVDPAFPEKLARFASAVAKRYPWIDAYTPVNEPLTTARFSGLYGLWYPHGRDERTFARCLFHQCRAVVLAMRAIREINPAAALVQTDDLGKVYSTPALRYQADYENERRWVAWDLLTGTLRPDGEIGAGLLRAGIHEQALAQFQEHPCPPDIIGVNHYITSDRFLDDNLALHPPETHGGNGRDRYADLAAVRLRPKGMAGVRGVLREAWERYRLPLAITEAHLGCTREEQLRWLAEIWQGAGELHLQGVDIRAVTVWSLLGAFDWNSLLTRQEGFYESGAFDLRGGAPRPTAIARMVRELAHGRSFTHPTLDVPGWWRREVRLKGRPILITGATGRLAQGFARAAASRGLPYRLFSHAELDIADRTAVQVALRSCQPWAMINCAEFSRVDDTERDEQTCTRSSTHGAAILAAACARTEVQLVTFSSDQGGDRARRMLAERQVLSACPKALVIRPGEGFTALEGPDFAGSSRRPSARGENLPIAGTPLTDLVHATLDLLVDGESGVWHMANSGAVTAEQFLLAAADIAQLDSGSIEGAPFLRLNRPARRPHYRVEQPVLLATP